MGLVAGGGSPGWGPPAGHDPRGGPSLPGAAAAGRERELLAPPQPPCSSSAAILRLASSWINKMALAASALQQPRGDGAQSGSGSSSSTAQRLTHWPPAAAAGTWMWSARGKWAPWGPARCAAAQRSTAESPRDARQPPWKPEKAPTPPPGTLCKGANRQPCCTTHPCSAGRLQHALAATSEHQMGIRDPRTGPGSGGKAHAARAKRARSAPQEDQAAG
jgi:hypothetical protein